MYTFIISAVFFMLLSGIIYRSRIKQNQFMVAVIVFAGTFLTSSVVNGIIGFQTPYTIIELKEVPLTSYRLSNIEFGDTLELKFASFVEFDYEVEEDGDTIIKHIGLTGWTDVDDQERLVIKYVSEDDSIPVRRVFQPRKLVDNKWAVSFGLPRGDKCWEMIVPNDSIHNEVMAYVDKYFYDGKD